MKKSFWYLGILLFLFSCNTREETSERLYFYQDEVAKDFAIVHGNDILTILQYSNENYKPFFNPVNTLNGTRITRGWPVDPFPYEPVDHPHQKGMWFNFGDVNRIDFWNNSDSIKPENKDKYGRILTDSISVEEISEDKGMFSLYTRWISEKGDLLLREKAEFRISVKDDYWQLDRKTTLRAETDITFSDNKEGLFAIRMAREFQSDTDKKQWILGENLEISKEERTENTGKSGNYIGSNGTSGKETWGTANEWVLLNGIKENDSISVLMMDHPSNFAHPPHWHARDYGLFSIDNFGRKAFIKDLDSLSLSLSTGNSLTLNHSIIIKSGGHFNVAKISEIFQSFVYP
jgi:hypothetical protein